MDRNELDNNVEETLKKCVIKMFMDGDPTDDILKGFNEVADHLFNITDDELTVLDQGIKMLVALDPHWINKNEQNTYNEVLKMMQEIIDLIWKEHE